MKPDHDTTDGAVLLALARRSVAEALGEDGRREPPEEPAAPWLERQRACFVTLHRGHALRGCIGTLHPHRSIRHDVWANARAAAFRDPRFPTVSAEELDTLSFEVSVLSPMEELPAATEQQVHDVVRRGVDGLYLTCGSRRGVFLPQVWKSYPGRTQFLERLRQKAGLPADQWPPEMRCWRFTVRSWEE